MDWDNSTAKCSVVGNYRLTDTSPADRKAFVELLSKCDLWLGFCQCMCIFEQISKWYDKNTPLKYYKCFSAGCTSVRYPISDFMFCFIAIFIMFFSVFSNSFNIIQGKNLLIIIFYISWFDFVIVVKFILIVFIDKKKDSGQEVYYWETIWPRFFSNR